MRLLLFFSLFLISSLSTLSLASETAVEPYGKLPEQSMFALSPSGNLVAFRQTYADVDVIKIVDMKKMTIVNQVDVTRVDPDGIYFVSDNNLVLRVSNTMVLPGYEGVHDIRVAFSYDLTTNKLHQLLVPGKGINAGQVEMSVVLGVSKDGKYAYMPAYAEDSSVFSLFRVRLDKAASPRVASRGTRDILDFFLNEDGEVIARERYNNRTNLHSIESKLSGKWETVYEIESEFITRSFSGLTPDRKNIVMLATSAKTQRFAYYTISLENGEIKGPLFSREDKDIEQTLSGFDRIVYGVRYSGFEPEYEFFDEALNRRIRGIKRALGGDAIYVSDYTPDWNNIVVYAEGNANSGKYLYYGNGSMSLLADARPDIPADKMNEVTEYSYKATDGMEIPALLTLPKGREAKNLPAIMMPHGGPEDYDVKGFDYRAQYFASQGYMVIQPQFRGSDGFGIDHLLAGRGEWGRKMQDDLTDAVIALSDQGVIDKNRVCIVGGSYGGYAALAGATFTPRLYKCAVSINGVSDIDTMIKNEKADYGKNHWVVAYWETVISEGDVDRDHLKDISPINHVDKIEIPVLLIHGTYDKVVPFEQSKRMSKKMKRAGKSVEYLQLPKGDHDISSAENRMKAMKAIASFVKDHI